MGPCAVEASKINPTRRIARYKPRVSNSRRRLRIRHSDEGLGPVSTVRSLVWVNMEPYLARERVQCEAVMTEIEKVRSQFDRFRTQSEPAYSRWFHQHFGEAVSRIRELAARALELERTVAAVQSEAMLSGDSERAAFQRLERMRAASAKIDEMRRDHAERTEQGQVNAKRSDLPPEVEEFLQMGFEQMFGDYELSKRDRAQMFEAFKQDFIDKLYRDPSGTDHSEQDRDTHRRAHRQKRSSTAKPSARMTGRSTERSKETPEEIRVKQLYRELARKLHPDVNDQLTQLERDLWHEVQAAYEARNLEQLETLAALVESGGGIGYARITNLSNLRAIHQDLLNKLKSAQKSLRMAKRNIAWNFDATEKNIAKLKLFAGRIENDLAMDLNDVTQDVAGLDRLIASWRRASSQGRGPTRGPRREVKSSKS